MFRRLLSFVLFSAAVELVTSLLWWGRLPSHGWRDLYGFEFWRYETQRIGPWLVAVVMASAILWFLARGAKKSAGLLR